VNSDDGDDPADRVSLDESLNRLLQVALGSLTAEQRVAFILHDVFGVPFDGIADVVGRSKESSRELTRSARRQIQQRKKLQASDDRHRSVILALLAGCEVQDETAVRALLHHRITVLVDSGGNVAAERTPVRGAERAASLLVRLLGEAPAVAVSEQSVNGYAGLVFRHDGRVVGVLSADIEAETIIDIWIVVNPEKLRHWNTA
jgi:RNA polymerase sigma-70 factor (ECF subfamily)